MWFLTPGQGLQARGGQSPAHRGGGAKLPAAIPAWAAGAELRWGSPGTQPLAWGPGGTAGVVGLGQPPCPPQPTHHTRDDVLTHGLMSARGSSGIWGITAAGLEVPRVPGTAMSRQAPMLPHGAGSVLTCAGNWAQHRTVGTPGPPPLQAGGQGQPGGPRGVKPPHPHPHLSPGGASSAPRHPWPGPVPISRPASVPVRVSPWGELAGFCLGPTSAEGKRTTRWRQGCPGTLQDPRSSLQATAQPHRHGAGHSTAHPPPPWARQPPGPHCPPMSPQPSTARCGRDSPSVASGTSRLSSRSSSTAASLLSPGPSASSSPSGSVGQGTRSAGALPPRGLGTPKGSQEGAQAGLTLQGPWAVPRGHTSPFLCTRGRVPMQGTRWQGALPVRGLDAPGRPMSPLGMAASVLMLAPVWNSMVLSISAT